MANIEKGFIPLRKVEEEQPLDKVRITLNLPPLVDQDRIGVNLARIDSLCRLSGIENLIVLGKTDEETSKVIPLVVGVNSDGSAVASKSLVKTDVPPYNSVFSGEEGYMSSRNIKLRININVDEVAQRAAEAKMGVRDPKVWAQNVDEGLRHSIRSVGTDNLIRNPDRFTKGFYLISLPLNAGINSVSDLINNGHLTEQPAINTMVFYALIRGVYLVSEVAQKIISKENIRYSVFIGPQLDRAAVLQLKTRTQKLVKDLHPDKK